MYRIAGILRASSNLEMGDSVRSMVERMCHAQGVIAGQGSFEKVHALAGWLFRAESLTEGPLWNEERTICLILACDDVDVRERGLGFSRRGHGSSRGGVGHLVALYEEYGPQFLTELNGCFSGLLIDLRAEKVILFNDRYGLGRVYYHESPDGFFFASEAKALLAVLPQLREVDMRGLAELFSVGCVLQNRTIFKKVSLLPPGSQWIFHNDGRIERSRYFDPVEWEQQDRLDCRNYTEQLEEVFSRIAPRSISGPSAVALSLTGGLDSRLLLAWARAAPGSLPCYSFGGPYRDCADVRIARRLAALTGQAHTTIPIGKDFFPEFAELAEQTVYLSDGTMDVSGAVELYVNRRAREIAPVRLTGNYGSEILRSNVAFRPRRLNRSLFTPEFCLLLDQAEETYRTESSGRRLSFIAFKQVPWHHYGRFSVEQSQLTVRSPFLDNELVALAYRAPREFAGSPEPLLRLIAAGNPALAEIGTDRALFLQSKPVLSRLAQAWQEFTTKAEYAYDYGMPTRLARIDHLCSSLHLEHLFLGRHKFYHFRIWYKQQLRSYLEGFPMGASSESFCYRSGAVREIVNGHLTGRDNYTLDLHKLLSVQIMDRLMISAQ